MRSLIKAPASERSAASNAVLYACYPDYMAATTTLALKRRDVVQDLVILVSELPRTQVEDLIAEMFAEAVEQAAPDLSYDPLFRAKLRGRVANRRLLRAAGPLLTEREVARLLRTKIGTVKRRRQKGALLGVDFAGRRGTSKFEYPQFQFVAARVIPGLPEVLRALATHPPWAKLRFLVSENDSLGGARPLDRIRAGDIESVLRSASVFGEQGAA